MPNRKPETITASEIAAFVDFPESRRLAQTGHKSANRAVQQAGTQHHAEKATADRVAGGSIDHGHVLIVLSVLALIMLILSAR